MFLFGCSESSSYENKIDLNSVPERPYADGPLCVALEKQDMLLEDGDKLSAEAHQIALQHDEELLRY
ncbi:MAG: hypothetical protein AAF621_05710 [Pseudomonadota bacterium]